MPETQSVCGDNSGLQNRGRHPPSSSSSSPSSSSFPSPNYLALGFGKQIRQAVLWLVSGRPQRPIASGFPCTFPNHPLDPLSAENSPIFGSGGDGRGLPAPRSPRAQSSASRMAAELRVGRGQQVRGYAWRSSHGPAGHQLGAAQQLGPAPPRLRPRPARGSAPAAQRSLFPAATGIGLDTARLAPTLHPASGLWPGFMRIVRASSSGSPSPRSLRSTSRRSVHHTLLSKKAGSIPLIAIHSIVIAVAVGR